MIPGMNPAMVKQAMKRMGIKQVDIDAKEVIIRCEDKDIIISDPVVSKIVMGGNESFQIEGESHEIAKDTKPEINDEDIKTVMEQTGKTEDEAKAAIEESKGDLAEAIMKLKEE